MTIPTSTRGAAALRAGGSPAATWGTLDPTEDLVFRAMVGVVDEAAWTCDVFRLPSSAKALVPGGVEPSTTLHWAPLGGVWARSACPDVPAYLLNS